MATTTRKTTKKPAAKSGSTQKRTPAKKKPAVQKKKTVQQNRSPIRREVGAVLCLFLALFSFLGCIGVRALFIDLFCSLLQGLLGYGFYLMPLLFLTAGILLLFHRGRPVRLRVSCALLLNLPIGGLLHLLLCRISYGALSAGMLSSLYQTGLTGESGGALSGTLAVLFAKIFSKVGAGILFLALLFFMLLVVTNRTVEDIVDAVKNRPRPMPYEYEAPEEEEVLSQPVAAAKPGTRSRRKNSVVIDLPVDDPIFMQEPETEQKSEPEEKRKSALFRPGSKPSPDEILRKQHQEEKTGENPRFAEQISRSVPGSSSPTEPDEIAPADIRPEMQKVKPEEARQAAAEVAKHIEDAEEQAGGTYQYPPVSLLTEGKKDNLEGVQTEMRRNQLRLEDTIQSFGIDAHIVNAVRGPSVTRYELELDRGVKLNKLTNLSEDIALSLGASGVRIAPIPHKISVVGIEVPNQLVQMVSIHEVIDSPEFRNHPSKVAFAIGKDIAGDNIVGNIAKLPHLLIAGTTGSGKSVCMNSLIISLLYKATPEEVRLIMIDPKMIELGIYNGIPHLLIPVVTDPKKAAGALQWAVTEMMKRYRLFSELNVRDIASYNAAAAKDPERKKLPQIVIVIDELADLMLVAAKDVEESVCRIAQMARAAGMHLIIATQRPSADVITGIMKANIPSRIAFAVASALESRIILDTQGAEKLVGRGDMLYFPLGSGKPTRVQGCMITGEEVERVAEFVKQYGQADYAEDVMQEIDKNAEKKEKGGSNHYNDSVEEGDELLPAAIDVVVETGQASVSMLQRRLKLGYSRAARLVDQMEERGIVGPFEGSKPRQLLITKEQWQEMQMRNSLVPQVPEEMEDSLPAEEGEEEMIPFELE
jgi:S-DNA-T family DNA segregation ATPase FtsK/SpoIIIE